MQAFATRSSRVRHRLVFLATVTAAAVGSLVGCGDDKAPSKQAVFWLGLSPANGGTCSSNRTYQIPEGARTTITSTNAVGERIEDDSDNLVECSVRAVSAGSLEHSVNLRFSGGAVGNFSAVGRVSKDAGGELEVSFNTGEFALEQANCTATVETVTPGAVWVKSLRCQSLREDSSPDIECDGVGGVIFENCDR
jgi:hypothetical protein